MYLKSNPLMLAVLFTSTLLIAACGTENPTGDVIKQIERPVKMMEIGSTQNESFLSFPAVLQAQQLSVLAFEVPGKLELLSAKGAQRVKKGDILAKLDQRDFLTKLDSTKAQFENAEAIYQRALRLIKEDAISRSALDDRKTQRNVTKAQYDTAKKALDDTVLRAPYTGIISNVAIELRQVIKAGEAAVTILGEGRFEATINLPASYISQGNRRRNSVDSHYVVVDAAPERHIPVEFDNISLEADPSSQTYAATFSFYVPDGLVILPGMNAVLWVKNNLKANNQMLIPLTAIVIDGDKKFAWVVNNGQVTRQEILLAEGIGEALTVTSGLKTGDVIVTAGISSLTEDMKVRPWSTSP